MRFILDVNGADSAARHIREIAHRAESPRQFFVEAAQMIVRDNKQLWQHNAWSPLDPDTVRRKASQNQPRQTLRATGTLERALTVWRAPGQKFEVDRNKMTIGLEPRGVASYGQYHQSGQGNPRRKILEMSRSTKDRVLKTLLSYLVGKE